MESIHIVLDIDATATKGSAAAVTLKVVLGTLRSAMLHPGGPADT